MERKIKYNLDKKNGLTKQQLEMMLLKWKKKLLMDDWDISLKIVDFERKDFRQSGDFIANPSQKKAEILLTYAPWRGDEEYTLVHEMIHILMYNLDQFLENSASSKNREEYLNKLEETVHKITQIILGRPKPKGLS